jgi:hypothetical protein
MDVKIASVLYFLCSAYVYKSKEIIFSIQLVPCQNSSRINRDHRNNISIVVTGIAMVIMHVATMVGYCALTGLVPPRSPKLVRTYLKTKAH